MIDLRTKEGQREEIKAYIRKHGGYSIFWITAHCRRAKAATDMINSGELIASPGGYPWINAVVAKEEGNEGDDTGDINTSGM